MPASKWSQKPLTSQASKSHVKAQKQLLKRYAHMAACRPQYSLDPEAEWHVCCVWVCSPVAPVPIYQDPDLKQPTPHDKKADIPVSAL
jgi:hypothetical protein